MGTLSSGWILNLASKAYLGPGIRAPKPNHILPSISKKLHDGKLMKHLVLRQNKLCMDQNVL